MAAAVPVGGDAVPIPPPKRSVLSGRRVRRLSTAALVVVGLVNFGLVLGMPGLHNGFTTDEVDYLAKVVPGAPQLYWTAVRAWGTPLLAAPIAIFSPGVGLVRLYFAILLSMGLVLAYFPWRRVLHPGVAPLAAFLFGTTWFATFYGNNVMPNYPIACGCVAATGLWAGLPQSSRPGRALVGLALVVGGVALIRPSDSLLLAAPLAVVTVLDRGRNRKVGILALLAGEVIGWVPWVVEAYLTFGGPVARWHVASSELGGLHLRFVMAGVYPRLFDGSPGYCCYDHPASAAGPASATAIAWMIAVLVLAVGGLIAAWRLRRLSAVGACAAVAAAFLLMYVGLLDYGSIRFLLPIVGLLTIPVATFLVWAVGAVPRRATAAVAVGCVGVVAAHLTLQISQDLIFRPRTLETRRVPLSIAAQTKRYVQHRPCLVVAPIPQVFAYYLRCHVVHTATGMRSEAAQAVRSGWSVIAITKSRHLRGAYAFIKQEGWIRHPLHDLGSARQQYVYLPPKGLSTAPTPTAATGG
jgi:hypothetical protein